MNLRRAILAVFSSSMLLGLGWGCSAADDLSGLPDGSAGTTGVSEAGTDGQILDIDGSMGEDGGPLVLNRLCGRAPSCVPDPLNSLCASYEPAKPPQVGEPPAVADPIPTAPEGQTGASGSGGEGGTAGTANSASAGEGGTTSDAGAGGASGAAGAAGAISAAGAAGSTAGSEAGGTGVAPILFGCQVRRVPSKPNTVVSACGAVGTGGNNAPCLTASDCQPGFGCVGDRNSGLCQQYCCQSGDECNPGSYCAERPLRDETINAQTPGSVSSSPALLIPVCVAAENCDLNAPYPCTKGTQCACQAGTACLVVRSDGTTTCAVPGTGTGGKACPCAWGHVCSAATNECLKLCYTRGTPSCGDGKCQAASELPDGWGVCVGASTPG